MGATMDRIGRRLGCVTRFYDGEYKDGVMQFAFDAHTPQGKQPGGSDSLTRGRTRYVNGAKPLQMRGRPGPPTMISLTSGKNERCHRFMIIFYRFCHCGFTCNLLNFSES